MKIVICDDQKYICEEVSLLCKEYFLKREKICEIYCCSSGKEYLECGIEPDILFLDIELGDMTGIEIADMTALGMKETYIIYISNYVDYMQQIIDINVLGFLEKPLTESKINNILDKFFRRKEDLQCIYKSTETNILVKDVICIKAESSYSKIILKNGHSVLVRKGLNQWEKELKKYSFYRIHQSWIVNLRYIIKYNSAKAVIYLPSMEISVSRRKKSDFEEIYANFLRRKR